MKAGKKHPGLRDRIRYALSTARGTTIRYDLSIWRPIVAAIRDTDLRTLSNDGITARARAMRLRVDAGADLDGELPECFALAAEACRRSLGLEPFDEQLMAGIAMHHGMLAQMQTGEGKTLAAVFPASLNAQRGRGVHVLTANDYLARRDAAWMGPVYALLGLRACAVGASDTPGQRRAAYGSDVTYLTAQEAGFDYLRDGLCHEPRGIVQSGFGMAIVDEADFILIDEARVPLVIAGASETNPAEVIAADACASRFEPGTDFTVDREARRVEILPEGHRRIERELGVAGIHEARGAECFARVYAALHARHLLSRDIDYVIKDGRIELVDAFTGRVADRRQWPWGVQPALEVFEGVPPRPEGRIFGSITVRHFMARYEKLAAMTATAVPSADELMTAYGLPTVIIPTVAPVARIDEPDAVFLTRAEKMQALVDEICRAHAVGRPVLVGTASVRESRELADLLAARGLSPEVLNAADDAREAEIIAAAGSAGALTISTNMAGRGTDIRLADSGVAGLGGLYVIGTNRHESRRIDDQLRGRAGRQGEPGSSRFFISLEDPLFERYGVPEFLPRDLDVGDPRLLREIDRAQAIIDGRNHTIRRTLAKYSQLVELDRKTVRALRDDALLEGILPPPIEDALPGPEMRARAAAAYICLLDRFWSDHLLIVEEVREGIHLERYAGRDPGLEYIHRVGRAFDDGLAGVETTIADACIRAAEDPGALDPAGLGAPKPSSTWTYQVDDEVPARFNIAGLGGGMAGALAAGPVLLLGSLWDAVKRAVKGRPLS